MKNIKIYTLLLALMFAVTSCLDKYPEDAVLEGEAITTVEQADQAVIGIYSAFLSSALYSGYLTLIPDLQADFVYAVEGYSNTYGGFWRWDIIPTSSEVEAVYASLYDIIGRCNFLLENTAKMKPLITNDSELDLIDQYEGEAYFARALAYSELIKLYCKSYESKEEAENELGVVITETYYPKGKIKRSSLEESYRFVIKDLERAADLLALDEDYEPSVDGYLFNVSEYFNEYTVYALRARIALYMKDWDAAIEYSSKIIDSEYYALSSATEYFSSEYTYFDYMWATDLASEIIWKVGFTSTNYGGRLGRIFFNYDYVSYKPDYVPAKWVLDLYSSNDLRYSSYFYEMATGYSHGLTWPLLVKYWGNTDLYSQNAVLNLSMPKVFRLAEQYLIRAEAYCCKETPDYSRAGKDISTLRAARCSSYGGSTPMNAENAMDIIEEERVKELYMEGFRLTDLKRWHKGFERVPQSHSLTHGSSLKVEADDPLFVWPIPQHELESPGTDIEPNESNK